MRLAGKGSNATLPFLVGKQNATFTAQVTDALPGPKLSAVKTVAAYSDWMVGVVKEFGPKATYDIKARAADLSSSNVIFVATFAKISDYVYTLHFNGDCKIDAMTKVWNDGYAAKFPPP